MRDLLGDLLGAKNAGVTASVHTGGTAGQPTNQGRTPVREQILDTRGHTHDSDARNIMNAKRRGDVEARVVDGYHPSVRWLLR
jgi:hypothetical protein